MITHPRFRAWDLGIQGFGFLSRPDYLAVSVGVATDRDSPQRIRKGGAQRSPATVALNPKP